MTIDKDAPRIGLIKARDEIDERRLAGARRAHKGRRRPGRNVHVDVVQGRSVVGIGKRDLFEFDGAGASGEINGPIATDDRRARIDKRQHALESGEAFLRDSIQRTEPARRLRQKQKRNDEADKFRCRKRAGVNAQGDNRDNNRERHRSGEENKRLVGAAGEGHFFQEAKPRLESVRRAGALQRFNLIGAHHAGAREAFADKAGDRPRLFLRAGGCAPQDFADTRNG